MGPPDLHGFYKWVFDSLDVLNDFTKQVVVSRRDTGVRKWINCLREDLGTGPYAWLGPDFDLLDAESRKAWMPLFCWSGHPAVTVDQFLDFVGHLLPQERQFDLPRSTGRDLKEVARAKKSTAGGLDGRAWNEVKALPLPWFSGLAVLSELVESSGVWPQGLLDAYIAMIPKADGDSTPLGRRPLSVLPVVCRLWAFLRLGRLGGMG